MKSTTKKVKNIKALNYRRHLAMAYCEKCDDIMVSKGGGIFVGCACGESFIDQERFDGRWVRLGGKAKFIEQICACNCKLKEHGNSLPTNKKK